METDSPVVYHGTSESRFPPEQMQKTQIQLSQEEIRLLRECNSESFYYRCLPLAAAGMMATYMAIRKGYLKSHPRWGPSLKMTGAGFVGWFVGKFSYRSKCEEKFLSLRNSSVADAIRKRRGYPQETFASEGLSQFPDEDNTFKGDSYKPISHDHNSSSASLNLDVDKNVQYSGLDDRERPSTDRENANLEQDEPRQKHTSYDELRKRNREEYERQLQSQARPNQNAPVRRQWGQPDSDRAKTDGTSKNAYGDSWENPNYSS